MIVFKHGGLELLDRIPQLREAQTRASGRLPGTPAQRLAAIANGDGICGTHTSAVARAHPQYHDRHRRRHNDN